MQFLGVLHVAGAASPVEAPHLLGTRVLSPKWCYQPIFIAVYLQFFQRVRIRKQSCSKSLGSVWTWRQQLVSLAALPAWGQILGHWTTPLADDGDGDDDDDGDDDGDHDIDGDNDDDDDDDVNDGDDDVGDDFDKDDDKEEEYDQVFGINYQGLLLEGKLLSLSHYSS